MGKVTIDPEQLYKTLAKGIQHDDDLMMPLELLYAAVQQLDEDNAALRAEVERLRGALEQVLNSGSIRESERIAQAALQASKAQGE